MAGESPTVITTIADVTAEWLTAVLQRSGSLSRGTVVAFELDEGRGNWSSNARLGLRYSPDVAGERPSRLFLKMTATDLGDGETFGPSEVDYYTRDYIDVPEAPLIRCHDAAWSPSLQRYHILLDDVGETHEEAWARPPTLDYGLALAEAMATLHARWWGEAKLAEAGAPIHSGRFIRDFVAVAEPGLDHIISAAGNELGDALADHWPTTLRRLFARLPQAMIARTAGANGFTLIHGDPGAYNILIPRIGQRPIYLIDRQPFNWSLTTWLGVFDLVYAMVLGWDIATRRTLEMPVLAHYHAQLARRGVGDYGWDRLLDDYRLSIGTAVFIPVEYCRGGLNYGAMKYWLAMLQRSLTAVDDLACAELW